jgi:hypothetical protein
MPLDREALAKIFNSAILQQYVADDNTVNENTTTPIDFMELIDGNVTIPHQHAWSRHRLPIKFDDPEAHADDKKDFIDIFVEDTVRRPSFLVWHTQAKNLEIANEYGGLAGESLTAKIIYNLGTYRGQALHRLRSGNFATDLAESKEVMTKNAIARVRSLQEIERLVNSKTASKADIVKVYQNYKAWLEAAKEKGQSVAEQFAVN